MEHHMTHEDMVRDSLVDRLHELVNDGRIADAVAMYEEYRSVFNETDTHLSRRRS